MLKLKYVVTVLLICFIHSRTYSSANESAVINIKPYSEYKFKKLYLCSYNPYYSLYERLKYEALYINGYFKFTISETVLGYYRIENEAGMGIGKDVFVEPGDEIYFDYKRTKFGIEFEVKGLSTANNTILQEIYPAFVEIDEIVKNEHRAFNGIPVILNFIDSLYSKKIEPKIHERKSVNPITSLYEHKILIPQLILLKEYYANQLSKKNELPYFYNDSLYKAPNHKFWSNQTLEASYFRNFLRAQVLKNSSNNLEMGINTAKKLFLKTPNDSFEKIIVANIISVFWEGYPQNEKFNIQITDSLINYYNLDAIKLNLPKNLFFSANILLAKDLDSIIFTSVANNKDISLSKLFSDSSKIYFLDHWASWCGPCIKEMPFSKQLEKKFKDKVVVIYLSKDNSYDNCIKIIERFKIRNNSYILNYDKTTTELYEKINSDPALPVYQILYYKNGIIYLKRTGYPSDESVYNEVYRLVNDKW